MITQQRPTYVPESRTSRTHDFMHITSSAINTGATLMDGFKELINTFVGFPWRLDGLWTPLGRYWKCQFPKSRHLPLFASCPTRHESLCEKAQGHLISGHDRIYNRLIASHADRASRVTDVQCPLGSSQKSVNASEMLGLRCVLP